MVKTYNKGFAKSLAGTVNTYIRFDKIKRK